MMYEIKNILDGSNSRISFEEERLVNLNTSIKIILNKTREKQDIKIKMKRASVICRTTSSSLIYT